MRPSQPTTVRWIAVGLIFCAVILSLAPSVIAQRRGDEPECEDRFVQMIPQAIEGQPFFVVYPQPQAPNGYAIVITSHIPSENPRERPEPLDQAEFDAVLQRAYAFRDQKAAEASSIPWSKKPTYAKSEHFEYATDIDGLRLHGTRERANTISIAASYAARGERIWNDWEAVMGPTTGGDITNGIPFRIYFHDTLQDCAITSRDLMDVQIDHGPRRGWSLSCMYWNRQDLPTDEDIWEYFTHFVAGMLGNQYRGQGRNQGNIPAWLDEGIAYYFTRIHRELDTHTTILYQEAAMEQASHIDGATWKRHAGRVADRRNNDEVQEIFQSSFSSLTQDERILGWSIVAFLVEYELDRVRRALAPLDSDEDGVVSEEEFMADPLRFDMDGDLELNDEEQREAQRQFQEADLNRDGDITIATEVVAHNFRRYLELQKNQGMGGGLSHPDALQQAYGWSVLEMLDRWRAWLADRPFQERDAVDLSATSWREYRRALEDAVENEDDPVRVARYMGTLARWQTEEAVAMLYEILEAYERQVERGVMERPLIIYEAAHIVIGQFRESEPVEGIFQMAYEGRCGRARTPNLGVRIWLYRGLVRNQHGMVNHRLSEGAEHEEFGIRVAMCDTLGDRGVALNADDEYRTLIDLLEDESRPVQAAAIQALAKLADRSKSDRFLAICDALVALFYNATGSLREEIYRAMIAITGEDLGPSHHRYAMWVQLYREAVREGTQGRRVEVPQDEGGEPEGPYADPPTYFGDEILAHQIVFVLDRSRSMMEPVDGESMRRQYTEERRRTRVETPGPNGEEEEEEEDDFPWERIHTKWDLAREMLIKAIEGMNEEYMFTIVLYDHRVFVWQDRMVHGTTSNIQSARSWVRNQPDPQTWGLTNIFDALRQSFALTIGESTRGGSEGRVVTGEDDEELAIEGAEEIRFLTDGDPTDGTYVNTEDILSRVREMNRTRKVRIYTYGLGRHNRELCSQLAQQNNGKYEDWSLGQ